MFISNDLVHHIQNSNLLFPFHRKVSKIGWDLDFWGYELDLYWKWYCLFATLCWRVVVFQIGIPKLLPYSWIPEEARVWKYVILSFLCFSFSMLLFLLIVFYYSHLNSSQSAHFHILLQLSSPLLLTAFNYVETGSCSSEMLPMMS